MALKAMAELAIEKGAGATKDGERSVYTVLLHATEDLTTAWVEGEHGRMPISPDAVFEAVQAGRAIKVEDIEDPGESFDRDGAPLVREGGAVAALKDASSEHPLTVIEVESPPAPVVATADAPRGSSTTLEDAPRGSSGSPLRPAGFDDIVGQERVVENLRLAAQAALARGEPAGHVLLSGPAGLGKTTLACALAAAMGTRIHTTMGSLLEQPHQLISLLTQLRAGDVLFINELHGLSKRCEECIYSALEDGFVNVIVAQGSHLRTSRVSLEPFTLVGATTQPGLLAEPFRSRFKIQETIEFYREEALAAIAERAAQRLGTSAGPDAAAAIARRARGTPREALRLLERARDIAQAAARSAIGIADVEEAAQRLGIDEHGLLPDDRRILRLLIAHGRPLGIEAIAATLRMDSQTIAAVNEPYLAEQGYLTRGRRGREATAKARRAYAG